MPPPDMPFFRQIHCFRRTRDLLLPRLLSGQVQLAKVESVNLKQGIRNAI